jgi:transaldolase
MEKVPAPLRDKLGIAIGQQVYKAYRDMLDSDRWQRLANFGARPQRLLFASTGTKDPKASDVLYIGALAAPNTINTMPEKTLISFAEHGKLSGTLPRTAETAKTFSVISEKQELISTNSEKICNRKALSHLMIPGKTYSAQSRPRAKACRVSPNPRRSRLEALIGLGFP